MKLKELTHAAVQRLDAAFLAGVAEATIDDELLEDAPRDIHLDGVRAILDEAMDRYRDRPAQSDSWLGPRLHAALRLTRREAARRGIWRYLAIVFAPDYVRWRWTREKEDGVTVAPGVDRFVGPDYKQAFARLWWMAELFRHGEDYSSATAALSNQDVTNNLFRADLAHHRPTALGAVAVLAGGDAVLGGREANALSKAANAAATTLLVDAIAPDEALDDAARDDWIDEGDDYDPTLYFDDLPRGPADPEVPQESLATMTQLLAELLDEAPVRGKAE